MKHQASSFLARIPSRSRNLFTSVQNPNLSSKSPIQQPQFPNPSHNPNPSSQKTSKTEVTRSSHSFGSSEKFEILTGTTNSNAIRRSHFRTFSSFAPQESSSSPAFSKEISAIATEVAELTLLEVADLTELLRKKLSVEEMPVMAVMMPGMGFAMPSGGSKAGGVASKVEEKPAEKTAFDLKLEGFDAASKIKIIKEVRTFTDLGLKEAKDLVEKTPTVLKTGVAKEDAEKIIEKMKAVGAKVVMV